MRTSTGTRKYVVIAAAIVAAIGAQQKLAMASDGASDTESASGLNAYAHAVGDGATPGGNGGGANATITSGVGTVDAEANGGAGAASLPTSTYAGDGGSGGGANANATSSADSFGNSDAEVYAIGGPGASGNNSEVPQFAGAAGAGGGASAMANATSSSTGTATASASTVAAGGGDLGYAKVGTGPSAYEDSGYEALAAAPVGISLVNQTIAFAAGGISASATANQTAGSGGGGNGFSRGGDGGDSALINCVSATVSDTANGSITLNQISQGGDGGGVNSVAGFGGTAGSPGQAMSIFNPSGTIAAHYANTTLEAIGGGCGYAPSSVSTIGGTAIVGEVISATDNLNLTLYAQGGSTESLCDFDGGEAILGGAGPTPGSTGNISVNATSTGGGTITFSAVVAGGGGLVDDFGVAAGDGGAAILQNPINLITTGDINAELKMKGGPGESALDGAEMGGSGAGMSILSNAFNISASTSSNVWLDQEAYGGGAGGSAFGATAPSGTAGNALSNATYSLDVALITISAQAFGGSDALSGGSATAIADATNTNANGTATAFALAIGGHAGSGYAIASAFGSVTVDGVTLTKSMVTTDGSNASVSLTLTGSSTGPTISSGGNYATIVIGPTCSAGNSSMTQTGGTVTADTLAIGDNSVSCPNAAVYYMQGGTLTIGTSTTINHTGTFNQSGGTASLANVSGNGTITLTGGSLAAARLSMPSGNVTANSTLTFSSTGATRQTSDIAVEIGNLTVGTAGLIDLTNHDLIIHGGSNLTVVAALIDAAYHSGAWDGTAGITSSTVAGATDKALGYATAGELGISTFDGITVSSTDILVKYTWEGDANLDGKVNLTDQNIVLNNLGSPGDWAHGDLNYDGSVGLSDFNQVSNTLGDGGSSPLAVVATPEPGSLAMLGVTSVLLLRRRKRLS